MARDRRLSHPIAVAPLLMLLATTKFRTRNPAAVLEGGVDLQIQFELFIFAMAGVLGLLALRQSRKLGVQMTRIETLLLFFAGLAFLSTAWSPIRSLTAVRSIQLILVAVLAMATVRTLGPVGTLLSLKRSIVAYVIVATCIALVFPSTVAEAFTTAQGIRRFSWFAVHPGIAATFTSIGIIALVPELASRGAMHGRGLGKIGVASLVALLLLVLLFTRVRIESAALILTLGAMAVRNSLPPRSRVAFVALLTTLCIAFWIFVVPWAGDAIDLRRVSDSEIASFLLRGQSLEEFQSLSGRIGLWKLTLPLILEAPVFGHGYAASRSVLIATVPWAAYAHNGLIQSILDLGLIGASLIWILAFRAFWKGARTSPGSATDAAVLGQAVFGILAFQLLSAGGGESFAATPGFHVYVFFICLIIADRLWITIEA